MLQKLCLILFILALPCACQLNYQERAIYIGESDNVCRYGDQCDRINLVISLDDSEVLNLNTGGHTMCYSWVLPLSSAIHPATIYGYIEPNEKHEIEFHEDTSIEEHYGTIFRIVQKTTINYATLYGKDYDCTIRGDGTVQHFGTQFKDHDPATFRIKCVSKGLTIEAE